MLSWKTPFEMLFRKPPSYGAIKVFGCLVFSTNVQPHKDKLAPRAIACVFLSLQTRTKGFKVYDLNSKRIVITMGVVFHEIRFPFIDSTF